MRVVAFFCCYLSSVAGLSAATFWVPSSVFTANGVIYASASSDTDGNVYFGSHGGSFFSLHPNGSLRWRFDGINDWIESTATLTSDGAVVFGSWNGKVYALETATGQLRWEFPTGSYVIASPALLPDGRIVVGSGGGVLYCLTSQGTLSWFFVNDTEIESSPAVDSQGNIYFGTMEGKLVSLTKDGQLRWIFQTTPVQGRFRSIQSSPGLGRDGTLYVGSSNGYLYALDTDTGTAIWSFQAEDAIDSSPAVAPDGTLYFGSRDGYLYALDPTGIQLWEVFVGDVFYSSPAIDSAGDVYIAGYVGGGLTTLWHISADGAVVRTHSFAGINDSSALLTTTGTLWIGMYDDYSMHAFQTAPAAHSGWPQFRNSQARTGLQTSSLNEGILSPDQVFMHFQWVGNGFASINGWSLGATYAGLFPWVWHAEHKWCYVVSSSTSAVWIYEYDGSLGWLYWDQILPATYYWVQGQTWIRHAVGTGLAPGETRLFFNYNSGEWFEQN
ncbi:MAG: PQQ-binding-like beta-propeller repeat protein [Verrucomicrobia bacterium]|nr:PQQ-binding-like beta-propeller repeat protein [Verrucomicrobiota bacterium]